jgi:hypothetical protein
VGRWFARERCWHYHHSTSRFANLPLSRSHLTIDCSPRGVEGVALKVPPLSSD